MNNTLRKLFNILIWSFFVGLFLLIVGLVWLGVFTIWGMVF